MAALRQVPTFFYRLRPIVLSSSSLVSNKKIPSYFFKRNVSYQYPPDSTPFQQKLGPSQPFLNEPSLLFSWQGIMKHWEVLPIVLVVVVGFTCEILYIIRNAMTRDDVQYTRGPATDEIIETRSGPMYKPPIRKMKVYNQKYSRPDGLIAAVAGGDGYECPMEQVGEPPKKLDYYLIIGRLVPWILWGSFLYLFDLF